MLKVSRIQPLASIQASDTKAYTPTSNRDMRISGARRLQVKNIGPPASVSYRIAYSEFTGSFDSKLGVTLFAKLASHRCNFFMFLFTPDGRIVTQGGVGWWQTVLPYSRSP